MATIYQRGLASGVVLCVVGLAAACAGGQGAGAATPSAQLTPSALYPLQTGYAWSYDVEAGDGQPVLATASVLRLEQGIAEVKTGQGLQRYEVSAEGIKRLQNGLFLLRAPIALGAQWRSASDADAHVVALGQTLTTRAGTFESCVVVRERHTESSQEVTTTYCPGIGPVRIESQMQVRGKLLRVLADLRGYNTQTP